MSEAFDNRLRPVVEFLPGAIFICSAAVMFSAPATIFPILPGLAIVTASGFTTLGFWRLWQGMQICRYQRHLRRLPRYVLNASQIPVSNHKLFLGRGFKWDQRHTQRLVESRHPQAQRFLEPGVLYRLARRIEIRLERVPFLSWLPRLTQRDSKWNPVRPLPPVGGAPALHGIGTEEETDIWMDIGERVGHKLVLGTTRVGKTRLLEILVSQDIRRGDTVICFDPKGDIDLLRRMHAEAKRAGRLDQFHIFHLGFPDISERYNPVGDFARITEVASRISGQLPSEGNSAAFREFAWRFTNVVSRALVGLGRRPDYHTIARYVTNIEPLLTDYYHLWLTTVAQDDWKKSVQRIEGTLNEKTLPMALRGRAFHAIALTRYAKDHNLFDPVADGLRSAFEYDKTYFDKLTASLLPLLEKLTSGRIGALLSPDYKDNIDRRPILDWMRVIREQGIVYVGLDALTDAEVAGAVGNSMFADLTSVAGQLYKHGEVQGLPQLNGHKGVKKTIHADEFNELIGDEFIPLLNKAGGAGFQVTAYTQTASDIEAGIGDRAKAGQVTGNLNSLIMLRVKNEITARTLTDQLPKARVYTKLAASQVTDNNEPGTSTDFTTRNEDRLTETEMDMLTPADLVQLPKGQAFALLDGGQLYKLRLPLPGNDPLLPGNMAEIEKERRNFYGLDDE
ncbi:MAG: type IV conjugative transfer system coupling protein TraD [Gammaproteobacteria bacterium]|nr:type IV conjugative transfer system coupling protein TraD [Gammaproteobacteria bacterium]MDH5651281.1 type IV conjugative transfer system coupling protein TraD [Gammaproteobacteria bacterium]